MLSRRCLVLGLPVVLAGLPGVASAQFADLPGVEPTVRRAAPPLERARVVRKSKQNAPDKKIKTASVSKLSKKPRKSPKKPFAIDPIFEPQQVDFYTLFLPGTIIVNSSQKFLYLVEPGNKARRYGVAIGMQGLGWTGTARIKGKVEWPSWKPTPDMLKRAPEKYARYKEGMKGGEGNPLGARAMYLYQGKRDTQIRIHGTTQPWTIGQAASNGCFRMVNEHIIDLYERVKYGAPVIVI
jgi:lipoprotein-anchoring transpeptidase ErfK/SrfK